MKWRTTGLLVALAVVLFAFIWFVERRVPARAGQGPARLFAFKASEVTNVQIRVTNQLLLRVERTNATSPWNLTLPIAYPAQPYAIEDLLQSLENLTARASITTDELSARKKSLAEFGLDVPLFTVTLQHNGQRTEVVFGAKTPVGDQVYLQVLNQPGVYIVNSDVLARLPRSPTDWRDVSLLTTAGFAPDRLEVRSSRGFAVVVDPTNKVFLLTRPTPARADRAKVEALVRALSASRVLQFVSDSPRADLDRYGLQPPEAELVLGLGTNDMVTVQFGKSPPDDPTVVYARRMSHTNIVLVPRQLLETLQIAPSELRDRHLITFPNGNANVDLIEVVGPENFTVRRQTNVWLVGDPPALADPGLVRDWINLFGTLEGTIEKDVVTDFATYGLAKPYRQYFLKTTVTNAAGILTNQLIGQIDIGTVRDEKAFARRGDEQSVYSIGRVDFDLLYGAAWQLRDRRVFSFTTNQVSRLTIRDRGYTRTLVRNGPGEWKLAAGSQGIISPFAVEEMMFKLGRLRARIWTARGEQARSFLGFTDTGLQLTIELKNNGDKPQVLLLEFGGTAWSKFPYAMATVDGESRIFEFPIDIFIPLQHDLRNPPPPGEKEF